MVLENTTTSKQNSDFPLHTLDFGLICTLLPHFGSELMFLFDRLFVCSRCFSRRRFPVHPERKCVFCLYEASTEPSDVWLKCWWPLVFLFFSFLTLFLSSVEGLHSLLMLLRPPAPELQQATRSLSGGHLKVALADSQNDLISS